VRCDYCIAELLFNVCDVFAAPGNVAESVQLEKQSGTVLTFSSGAKEAYLGYVTLRVCSPTPCCWLSRICSERNDVIFLVYKLSKCALFCLLQFAPDAVSTVPHHKHYALEVTDHCSPTIDHCIIRSTSVGTSEPATEHHMFK
jgi:F-box protein 11